MICFSGNHKHGVRVSKISLVLPSRRNKHSSNVKSCATIIEAAIGGFSHQDDRFLIPSQFFNVEESVIHQIRMKLQLRGSVFVGPARKFSLGKSSILKNQQFIKSEEVAAPR